MMNAEFFTTARIAGILLLLSLLPSWIGWAALAWSLLSFPLYYLVFGAPLVVILTPLLFGVGLLRS